MGLKDQANDGVRTLRDRYGKESTEVENGQMLVFVITEQTITANGRFYSYYVGPLESRSEVLKRFPAGMIHADSVSNTNLLQLSAR